LQYFPVLRARTAANYQGAPDVLNPKVTVDTLGTMICRTGSTKSIRPPGVYHYGRKTRRRSGIRLHGVTMPTRSLPILFFRAVNCQAVRDW
jgi:hypothetical protein